jgi:hypothetical protein
VPLPRRNARWPGGCRGRSRRSPRRRVVLALPAILLASLTLVAKEEGQNQARDDRGAALGTVGLVGFALVVTGAATRWLLWATLTTATAVWAVVALLAYGIARRAGGGDDEPDSRPTS